MAQQKLPDEILYEIALKTKDPLDVINQCSTEKNMAKLCNNTFWNKWRKIHNPPLYIIMDAPQHKVYNQLFFTPEFLYKKIREVILIERKKNIDQLLKEKLTEKFTTRNVETQIKKKYSESIPQTPPLSKALDDLNIVQFRPIQGQKVFYVVVYSPDVGTYGHITARKGVYKEGDEIEAVVNENKESFLHGYMWWVKIQMSDFKIGEITKGLPKEIEVTYNNPEDISFEEDDEDDEDIF